MNHPITTLDWWEGAADTQDGHGGWRPATPAEAERAAHSLGLHFDCEDGDRFLFGTDNPDFMVGERLIEVEVGPVRITIEGH